MTTISIVTLTAESFKQVNPNNPAITLLDKLQEHIDAVISKKQAPDSLRDAILAALS